MHSTTSAPVKWRRTGFTRIDGAVEIADDDWSLGIAGLSAARRSRQLRVCYAHGSVLA
jgi:hypothetical protein